MAAITFPIQVNAIKFDGGDVLREKLLFGGQCGDMVAVRPCADEYGGKTFLGVLLGEIALNMGVSFEQSTGDLTVKRYGHNPAIFVPELNAIAFGCGSWWGRIKDEAHLKQITDADVENVWYVRALKQLHTRSGGPPTQEF